MPPCHRTVSLGWGREGRSGHVRVSAAAVAGLLAVVLCLAGCAAGPGGGGNAPGKTAAGMGGVPGAEGEKTAQGARCEPEPSLMTPCPAPVALKPGMTYKELLEAHLSDRQQLQRCAARHDELRKAILACHWVAP